MDKARQQIKDVISSAANPAILCSFGKDSSVLLALAREVKPDIPIVYFKDRINCNAEKLITDWNLTVLSYAPLNRYLIPWDNDICLVDEMTIGNQLVPLIRDVELSEKCDVEQLSPIRTNFTWPFDVTLWGYRKADELHPAMSSPFSNDFQLGNTRMVAPLYNWSDSAVIDALSELSIPYQQHRDTIGICGKCMAQLGAWDRQASLDFFTRRFGYAQAA